MPHSRLQRIALLLTLAAGLAGAGWVVVTVAGMGDVWQSVERVSLEAGTSGDPQGATEGAISSDGGQPVGTPSPAADATGPGAGPSLTPSEDPQDRSSGSYAPSSSTTGTAPETTIPGPPGTTAPSSTSPATSHSSTTTTSTPSTAAAEPAPDVVLLVGSDRRENLADRFGDFSGARADVILIGFLGADRATLLSVPRDLWVPDRCGGGHHRIGEAFHACGGRHRLVNLADEIGFHFDVEIEHAAVVNMEGFEGIVDELGGHEVCVDHPTRDARSGLALDAGCTWVDGETTLAWLRSRYTEELIDGRWRRQPGVSDLTRNERQRRFLSTVADRLTRRSRPDELLAVLRALAPHLTIDDRLRVRDVAAWAWRYRDVPIESATIPVIDVTAADGAEVLEATDRLPEVAAAAAG